jgi:hypothetical protein
MKKISESNPFFNNYDDAYEKGRKDPDCGRNQRRSNSRKSEGTEFSDERGYGKGITNDGTTGGDGEVKIGGGFLSRVKSLKGGRRNRPERKD